MSLFDPNTAATAADYAWSAAEAAKRENQKLAAEIERIKAVLRLHGIDVPESPKPAPPARRVTMHDVLKERYGSLVEPVASERTVRAAGRPRR